MIIPKTEKELDLYFKLQELLEKKKIIDKGIWHFGSGEQFNNYVKNYEILKNDYLILANL